MDHDLDRTIKLIMSERRTGLSFLKHRLLLSESKVLRHLKELEKRGILSAEKPGGSRTILIDLPIDESARPA